MTLVLIYIEALASLIPEKNKNINLPIVSSDFLGKRPNSGLKLCCICLYQIIVIICILISFLYPCTLYISVHCKRLSALYSLKHKITLNRFINVTSVKWLRLLMFLKLLFQKLFSVIQHIIVIYSQRARIDESE